VPPEHPPLSVARSLSIPRFMLALGFDSNPKQLERARPRGEEIALSAAASGVGKGGALFFFFFFLERASAELWSVELQI